MLRAHWWVLGVVLLAVIVLLGLLAACASTRIDDNPTTDAGTATLSYHSFDGGGPSYTVTIEDPQVASCTQTQAYNDPKHDEIDGAAFDVILTFKGLQPGETRATVTSDSPIMESETEVYAVQVDDALHVTLTRLEEDDSSVQAIRPRAQLVMSVGDRQFYPYPAENETAAAFCDALNSGALELPAEDSGGFAKVGEQPWTLPENAETVTTQPGDIMLGEDGKLFVFYDADTQALTPVARIDGVTREELLGVLGEGDVTIGFWLEWDE